MIKLTTEGLKDIVKDIVNAKKVDTDLLPRVPLIKYYDNNDHEFYCDNTEIAFYGIRFMISNANLKGYYCTVETEWWDDNNEYHGNVGKRNYQKFYFNVDDESSMDTWNEDVFSFPFEMIKQTKKVHFERTKPMIKS